MIIEWLKRHSVSVPIKATKAELLELVFDNLPEKRYVVDEVAANIISKFYGKFFLFERCYDFIKARVAYLSSTVY